MSEWMKVMLDEIARKRAEAEQARAELERRAALPEPAPQTREHDPPQG
jgi:hypothetical protein